MEKKDWRWRLYKLLVYIDVDCGEQELGFAIGIEGVEKLEKLVERELDKAREEGRDKWLRFYRKDILNGFLPKCSCGKRATIQTARGKYAQENLQRPCNWGWYCKKCFKEGLELEREAMGYYDIPVTN